MSAKLTIGNDFKKNFVPRSIILSNIFVASFDLNFISTRRSISHEKNFLNRQSVAFRNGFGIV